jgi:hypothetical protein
MEATTCLFKVGSTKFKLQIIIDTDVTFDEIFNVKLYRELCTKFIFMRHFDGLKTVH